MDTSTFLVGKWLVKIFYKANLMGGRRGELSGKGGGIEEKNLWTQITVWWLQRGRKKVEEVMGRDKWWWMEIWLEWVNSQYSVQRVCCKIVLIVLTQFHLTTLNKKEQKGNLAICIKDLNNVQAFLSRNSSSGNQFQENNSD